MLFLVRACVVSLQSTSAVPKTRSCLQPCLLLSAMSNNKRAANVMKTEVSQHCCVLSASSVRSCWAEWVWSEGAHSAEGYHHFCMLTAPLERYRDSRRWDVGTQYALPSSSGYFYLLFSSQLWKPLQTKGYNVVQLEIPCLTFTNMQWYLVAILPLLSHFYLNV